MAKRIVASLHGANGVVIDTREVDLGPGTFFPSAFDMLATQCYDGWQHSVERGCRIVIGIPDDAS